MIITVTLNPAIDKTVYIDKLKAKTLNRVSSSLFDIGGKGINVSKTISSLNSVSIATGLLGKDNNSFIINGLNYLSIENDFVYVDGSVRTNLKVIEEDGSLTEINESGPTINKDKIDELILKLDKYANEENIFVFSGSVPKGVDSNIYAYLTNRLKQKGSKVVVDADDELLSLAIKESPTVIKPNMYELSKLVDIDENSDDTTIINKCRSLLDHGIQIICVSKGKDGALFISNHYCYSAKAIDVEVKSSVGAGDAMVAALAYGLQNNMDYLDMFKLALATSAGAVMSKGTSPASLEVVNELIEKIEIQTL